MRTVGYSSYEMYRLRGGDAKVVTMPVPVLVRVKVAEDWGSNNSKTVVLAWHLLEMIHGLTCFRISSMMHIHIPASIPET
jgi:hypothetical protein